MAAMLVSGGVWANMMSAYPTTSDATALMPDGKKQQKKTKREVKIDTVNAKRVNMESSIHLLVRTYGDSIVLRWAGADYATQHYLYRVGVNITRYDLSNMHCDTLALALKPWTKEKFRNTYPESDSIAYAGLGMIFNKTYVGAEGTGYPAGSFGSLVEMHDDQQFRHAISVLVSEWRPDVANGLAMRWVDKDVKKNHEYEYVIQPAEWDNRLPIRAGHISSIKNVSHKPEKFNVQMGDSIVNDNTVRLWWEHGSYSSYEIERREVGIGDWERVNEHTYVVMESQGQVATDHDYADVLPHPGIYEYRIMAHDAFGELTEPCPPHTIVLKDSKAPTAPILKYIVLDRRDKKDPMNDIYATFHFQKDILEEDFVGYVPLYYNSRMKTKEWKKLTDRIIPPKDTTFTVNVTGLTTGYVTIAAYDKNGNMSTSLPQMIRIDDRKAPEVPKLKCEVNAENGTALLQWTCPDDDVEFYEIEYANDTTHMAARLATTDGKTFQYTDTLAMDVNQRYVYYKIRALDYSGNYSRFSPYLQVERPHNTMPEVAVLDTAYVLQDGIHMQWVVPGEAQVKRYLVSRRCGNDSSWKLLESMNADSIATKGNVISVVDKPEYDRMNRYQYVVECVAVSGLISHSLVYSTSFEGPAAFDWDIKLYSRYDAKREFVSLSWETKTPLPFKGDWYYCIYRKQNGDSRMKFWDSCPASESIYELRQNPGETTEYCIRIKYNDGRASSYSNVVNVVAPEKK